MSARRALFVGCLVERIDDDSAVPTVGLVVTQPADDYVGVVWGEQRFAAVPEPSETRPEYLDELRPARKGLAQ